MDQDGRFHREEQWGEIEEMYWEVVKRAELINTEKEWKGEEECLVEKEGRAVAETLGRMFRQYKNRSRKDKKYS